MIWRNNLKGYDEKINKKLRREKNAEKYQTKNLEGMGPKSRKNFSETHEPSAPLLVSIGWSHTMHV